MKFTKLTGFLLVLFFTAAAPKVFSQSTGMGIEAGINLSNINVTPTFNTNSRTGMMVGGYAEIGVSDIVYIRPGLRYVMKGFSSGGNGVTYTDRLSYLEIPLLLKVRLPLAKVKPYFMAGPTLGIQLSASEEATNGVQTQESDAGQVFESVDFGLFFGSGMDFKVAANTEMFFGAGYSLGLSNVVKLPGVTAKNSGIQFMGGVKFGL